MPKPSPVPLPTPFVVKNGSNVHGWTFCGDVLAITSCFNYDMIPTEMRNYWNRHYYTVPKLLVKVNSINEGEHKAMVTMLDIDDYGSIVPLDDLKLNLPLNDNSVIHILKNSAYAAIFTEG